MQRLGITLSSAGVFLYAFFGITLFLYSYFSVYLELVHSILSDSDLLWLASCWLSRASIINHTGSGDWMRLTWAQMRSGAKNTLTTAKLDLAARLFRRWISSLSRGYLTTTYVPGTRGQTDKLSVWRLFCYARDFVDRPLISTKKVASWKEIRLQSGEMSGCLKLQV